MRKRERVVESKRNKESVCVCMCEKEREREWTGRQAKSDRAQIYIARDVCGERERERERVCVCV